MAKKILIVSSSLRSGSNSEILAHEDEKKVRFLALLQGQED